MSKGMCDTCKNYGKCEWTRNGRIVNYTAYCYGYKPTKKPPICDAEMKPIHSDSDKLERLRKHLDDVEKGIYKKLKNAEKDEEQYLLGIQSAIKEIKDWV